MAYVTGVVATTDVVEACAGVNIAVMVGGFPRKEGMERKDVMSKNVSIYKSQASALEKHAAANCKVMKLSEETDWFWIHQGTSHFEEHILFRIISGIN